MSSLAVPLAFQINPDCHDPRHAHACPIVTTALALPNEVAYGFQDGSIRLYKWMPGNEHENVPSLDLQAVAFAHTSPIHSLLTAFVAVPEGGGQILFSADTHGRICKFNLPSVRALRSAQVPFPPLGMLLLDTLLIVYGQSCEIHLLSVHTLETHMVWTGLKDWLIPVPLTGDRLFTVDKDGACQLWKIWMDQRLIERVPDPAISTLRLGSKDFGRVLQVRKIADRKWVVLQSDGWSLYSWSKKTLRLITLQPTPSISRKVIIDTMQLEKREFPVSFGITTLKDELLWITCNDSGPLSIDNLIPLEDKSSIRVFCISLQNDLLIKVCHHKGRTWWSHCKVSSPPNERCWSSDKELSVSPTNTAADACYVSSPPHFTILANHMVVVSSDHSALIDIYSINDFLQQGIEAKLEKKIMRSDFGVHGRQPFDVTLLTCIPIEGRNVLIAGTSNGRAFFFDDQFQCTGHMTVLSCCVTGASLFPSDSGRRVRKLAIMWGADNTVAIADYECGLLMYTIPGHDVQLVSISTCRAKNFVAFEYADGYKRAWNLGTEKEVSNFHSISTPEYIWTATVLLPNDNTSEDKEFSTQATLSYGDNAIIFLGIPAIVKRIQTQARELESDIDPTSTVTSIQPTDNSIMTAKALLSVIYPKPLLEKVLRKASSGHGGKEKISRELINTIIETAYSGTHSSVNSKTGPRLGLKGMHHRATTLYATKDLGDVFCIGGDMSALCLLTSIVLLLCIYSALGKPSSDLHKAIPLILRQTMRHVGNNGKEPWLSTFARYTLHPDPLVSSTAKICLSETVGRLGLEEVLSCLSYWRSLLPATVSSELFVSEESKLALQLSSRIVLAHVNVVSYPMLREVAISLELFLGDRHTDCQDLAIDLISQGWLTWQSHFDSLQVIYTIMSIGVERSVMDTVKTTLNTVPKDGSAGNKKSSPPKAAGTILSTWDYSLPKEIRVALIKIGEQNPHLLLTTATEAMIDPSHPLLLLATMKLTTVLIHKDPSLAGDQLGMIMQGLVKSLDVHEYPSTFDLLAALRSKIPSSKLQAMISNHQFVQDSVVPGVTMLLSECVSLYPTVTFHRGLQRLAVCIAPGVIIVYDLRTSNVVATLEDKVYQHQITVLKFSPEGKYLAGLDVEFHKVIVWKMGFGFLSLLHAITSAGSSDGGGNANSGGNRQHHSRPHNNRTSSSSSMSSIADGTNSISFSQGGGSRRYSPKEISRVGSSSTLGSTGSVGLSPGAGNIAIGGGGGAGSNMAGSTSEDLGSTVYPRFVDTYHVVPNNSTASTSHIQSSSFQHPSTTTTAAAVNTLSNKSVTSVNLDWLTEKKLCVLAPGLEPQIFNLS